MSPIVLSVLITASIVLVAPTNTSEPLAHGVSRNPLDATSQTFDYVIVGGGLTGITVAARLAENPSEPMGPARTKYLYIQTGCRL